MLGVDWSVRYREEATMSRTQNLAIRIILENVEAYPGTITSVAAKKFGMTRTGIARYMHRLIAHELIRENQSTAQSAEAAE